MHACMQACARSALTPPPCPTACTANQVVVPGSLSLAWRIGMALLRARAAQADPVAALLALYAGAGRLLGTGAVTDVRRDTAAGFVRGHLTVAAAAARQAGGGSDDGGSGGELVIEFQNASLVVWRRGGDERACLACVPDLICVLEAATGAAVATEDLRYGLRVAVVALPSHPLLRTPAALAAVGPGAFGLGPGVEYLPLGAFPELPTVHDEAARPGVGSWCV